MSVDQFWKTFDWAAAQAKVMAMKPTYPTKLGLDLTNGNPHVTRTEFHGTASGIRMVLQYDYDSEHTYEVLITPIFPKK